jgi:hypothetical protein
VLGKNKKPFRKICQNKNLPDSDPDLTSSSLVTFGKKFDCILLHIQNLFQEFQGAIIDYLPWLYTQPLQQIGGC